MKKIAIQISKIHVTEKLDCSDLYFAYILCVFI